MAKRISEVSKQLAVSSQTIRNYLAIGSEFFSERATQKTRKRFSEFDIQQLQTIKELLASGTNYEDIPQHLTPAPRVVEETEPEETEPKQTSAIERQYQQILTMQQLGHEKEIAAKNETIAILREELRLARLPWWRRLFDNSPK